MSADHATLAQDHRSRANALFDAGRAPRPTPVPPEHTAPGWDQVEPHRAEDDE